MSSLVVVVIVDDCMRFSSYAHKSVGPPQHITSAHCMLQCRSESKHSNIFTYPQDIRTRNLGVAGAINLHKGEGRCTMYCKITETMYGVLQNR